MSFRKYPKIYTLGHERNRDIFAYPEDYIIVEEKVDGGNGSFWLDDKDKEIHMGSRNRDLVEEKDKKAFIKQRLSLLKTLKGKKLDPNYIYYVEWMAPHSIKYDTAPNVIGLDIRLKHSIEGGPGLFISRGQREKEFDRLGIENVPLVWEGQARDLKKTTLEKLIGKSKYYDGTMEGIVIKNYARKASAGNHQIYAKVKTEEFKEKNQAVFGSIKSKSSDTMKITDQFCTDARIRKTVLKCINEENDKLDLKLMAKVPNRVIKDILAEEYENIFENYQFIDFPEMKKLVAKNCLTVLREMIQEQAVK